MEIPAEVEASRYQQVSLCISGSSGRSEFLNSRIENIMVLSPPPRNGRCYKHKAANDVVMSFEFPDGCGSVLVEFRHSPGPKLIFPPVISKAVYSTCNT